jgi:tyrosyl-tRNA synthetase
MGGDDQWGNIVAGMDLIRRVEGAEAFALTTPLVTRSDGQKMGKSVSGAIWLDGTKTSPYDFYQYWRNIPDADTGKFLALFTFLPMQQVRELGALRDREANQAKEVLALELTTIVHGKEEAEKARAAARRLFPAEAGGEGGEDSAAVPSAALTRAELEQGLNVVDALVRAKLCSTKSDARRLISQGGAYVDGQVVGSADLVLDRRYGEKKEILLRAGRKRYFRFLVQ